MQGIKFDSGKTQRIKEIFIELGKNDHELEQQELAATQIRNIVQKLEENIHIEWNKIGVECITQEVSNNSDNETIVELSPLAIACFNGWDKIIAAEEAKDL